MLQRVVHAKELGAQSGGDNVGGERPDKASVDPLAGKITKDRLAGDADEHRESEAAHLRNSTERGVILRARFAKADARIEKDESLCDASAAPVKRPVRRTTVSDPMPMTSNCSMMSWR